MEIRGIAHIAYKVSDMEKSLRFYCGVLGFREMFTLNNDAGEPWIIYLEVAPHQYIELFYDIDRAERVPLSFRTMDSRIGYMHLSLEVTGMKELEAHLRQSGVEILVPTRFGSDNTWQMWIEDPDGNPIEFHEYTDESYQLREV